MNRIIKYFLVLSGIVFVWSARPAFADEYDDLAKELCNVIISTGQVKIAILPFSYLDKRKSDGGAIVSERLTTRIVKLKKYQVIERALLENLIQEQHLETSGAVSVETAKQIGKILGVDAIISGTLLDVEDGMVEVNARLIKTETAEVLNTASVSIRKIWSDVSSSPPPPSSQQYQQQQPVKQEMPVQEEQPVYKQPAYASRGPKLDTYVDLFTILSAAGGKMDLVFNNTDRTFNGTELGSSDAYGHNKVSFTGLDTHGTTPIGARVAGFGKHWGFDIEMSYYSQTVAQQNGASVQYDDASQQTVSFNVNDYFKMSVFNLMSVDLLYRFSNKMIQPYVGAGIGLALDNFSSPYIEQYGGGTLNELSVGFLFRSPIIGVRVNVGSDTSLFIEQRTIANSSYFSRTYSGENDTVYLTTTQTIMGVGFKF